MTTADRLKKAKSLLRRAEKEIRTVTAEALATTDRIKRKKQRTEVNRAQAQQADNHYRLGSIAAQQIENTRHILDNFSGMS